MTDATRRSILLGAGALMTAPHVARGQPAEPVLRVVAPWEYTSNDPTDIGYILTRMQVAEGLVGVEPDGRLVGMVAERWTVDEDRLTWRFTIRPGLTFHDRSPVTAAAAARSLTTSFAGESLSNVPLDSISHEGKAVIIRTKTPFAPLPAFLVDYAAIILAPSAYGADGKVERIIATGPYRLVSTEGRTTLELERFDAFRAGPAPIARARYTAVPNGDTRANIAIAGDADLVFTLAPTAVPRIAAAGQMRVESVTIPRLRFITMNLGLPQFSDLRVRRAISLAIDRQGIAAAILRHPPSAATQLLPPVLTEWHNPDLPALTTDVAAARRLLDEAGWTAQPDGVRSKDGARLEATLMTVGNRPELPVMATALQAQLRAIGMAINISVGQTASIPAAVRDGTMQMTMFARTYVNVPDPIATVIPDYTRERSVWGTMNWDARARMQVLTDAYVGSFDDRERATLRRRITALIHEEMPVIPVSWFEHTIAVNRRVTGATVDPFEMRYLLDRIRFA
jgi:peptide/nickel transport system substrate-binding protein